MSAEKTKAWILGWIAVAVIFSFIAAAGWHYSLLSSKFQRWSDFSFDPHGGIGLFGPIYLFAIVPLAVPIMCAVGLALFLLSRSGQRNLDGLIRIIAKTVIVAWLPCILFSLAVPVVILQAPQMLPGVTLMIAITDLLGVTHLVSPWVFMAASLIITMAVAIFLLAGKRPPGSDRDSS